MNKLPITLLATCLLFSSAAGAQAPAFIRGTITAFEGNMLSVKSRDGAQLTLELAADTTVAAAKAIMLADLKPGAYVGCAAKRRPDGELVALEVHTISPAVPAGFLPSWDLEPGATMTNAHLVAVLRTAGGNEITLEYPGGAQKILVPDGAPIVTTVPADRSALEPGEYVFVVPRKAPDGRITALRIQVSRNGVRPPQ
ncbi:MAG TPA: DUF5666 domain-containing protein [Burkholderiales bacterium]|nr:DUF5666 domain-containing protein [Burkholderiales bacterium]